jgi:hypothetical protein
MPQICTYGWSRIGRRIIRPLYVKAKPLVAASPSASASVAPPPVSAKTAPVRRALIDISNAPSSMEQRAAAWSAKGAIDV